MESPASTETTPQTAATSSANVHPDLNGDPPPAAKFLVRRHFIVDPPLQISLLLRTVCWTGLVMLTMGIGMLAPLVVEISGHADGGELAYDTASAFVYIHEHFWSVALLGLFLLSLLSVHTSHRIAGPLVRFKRAIRRVADGEFPEPLRTRRGDYLKREVTDLNAMVQSLDTRIQAIRDAAAGIDGAIEDCRGSDGQLPDALAPVVQSTRELHSAVARFQNEDR